MVPAVPDITGVVVSGFQDFTKGLFGSLADMRRSDNQRAVAIEEIRADVKKYLETLWSDERLSIHSMDNFRSVYESQLNQSGLTFRERKELLESFTKAMLEILNRSLRR